MDDKKKKTQKNKKVENNNDTKKQSNKNNKTKKQDTKNTITKENEASKLIRIILIVTIIMAVFYGITILVTNQADKINTEEKIKQTKENAKIQYEKIIIGSMLEREGTYYVLIIETDDNRLEEYTSIIESINKKDNAPIIYTADLSDGFNKNYLAKEANLKPENIDEFAVTGTTLVKIQDKKIDSTYDNYTDIKNKLNELIK